MRHKKLVFTFIGVAMIVFIAACAAFSDWYVSPQTWAEQANLTKVMKEPGHMPIQLLETQLTGASNYDILDIRSIVESRTGGNLSQSQPGTEFIQLPIPYRDWRDQRLEPMEHKLLRWIGLDD